GPLIVGDGGRFGMSWQAEQFCRRYGTEWSMTALDGANITPEAAARPARTAENSDRPRRPVRQGRACAVGRGESPCSGARATSFRARDLRPPHRAPAPRPTGGARSSPPPDADARAADATAPCTAPTREDRSMTTVTDFTIDRLIAWALHRFYRYPGDGI